MFPEALLMAREPVAWGATGEALTPENLLRARRMTEAWDEQAPWHDGTARAVRTDERCRVSDRPVRPVRLHDAGRWWAR